MSEPSIFTKIISGEIPCHKVYEDDKTLAFLDIHPFAAGQTLVIPKKQVEFVWDLSEEDYRAVWSTARKVALKLREVFPEKTHIGTHVEGLDVPHAHIKVFAFSNDNEFCAKPNQNTEPDHASLAKLAQRLLISK